MCSRRIAMVSSVSKSVCECEAYFAFGSCGLPGLLILARGRLLETPRALGRLPAVNRASGSSVVEQGGQKMSSAAVSVTRGAGTDDPEPESYVTRPPL